MYSLLAKIFKEGAIEEEAFQEVSIPLSELKIRKEAPENKIKMDQGQQAQVLSKEEANIRKERQEKNQRQNQFRKTRQRQQRNAGLRKKSKICT